MQISKARPSNLLARFWSAFSQSYPLKAECIDTFSTKTLTPPDPSKHLPFESIVIKTLLGSNVSLLYSARTLV